MTVNLNTGIDYNQWQKLNTGTTRTNSSSAYYTTSTGSDYYVSSSGETCTDGKDDGKIGFFSAIGNAIKGVGKTIVNGVKSCFTNSEGKFSLGKTLLTAATAAVCIAFPAVGLAACAVGAVSGAITVGKGIYGAVTATTDGEAKEAWQNIGGGTFTAAVSVAGAKASLKAVKSTSTAGVNGGSALDSLGKEATTGQKISALAKDCKSSTVNRASSIKNFFFGSKNANSAVDEKGLTISDKNTSNSAVDEKGLTISDKNTSNSVVDEKAITVSNGNSNSSGTANPTGTNPSGNSGVHAASSAETAASSAAAEVEQALKAGNIDKATYFKLIKMVHPDKWASEGISESTLAYLVELTQKLNQARVYA